MFETQPFRFLGKKPLRKELGAGYEQRVAKIANGKPPGRGMQHPGGFFICFVVVVTQI